MPDVRLCGDKKAIVGEADNLVGRQDVRVCMRTIEVVEWPE